MKPTPFITVMLVATWFMVLMSSFRLQDLQRHVEALEAAQHSNMESLQKLEKQCK